MPGTFSRRLTAVAGGAVALLVAGLPAQATPATPALPTTPAAPAGHGAHWHFAKPYEIPHLTAAVNGLACPTPKECIAVSSNTKVYWTTDPTGGKRKWHHATIEPATEPYVQGTIIFDDISCASAKLCVAVDDIGNAFISTHPTGGKHAWRGAGITDDELEAVGCSASGSCAAVDYDGAVYSTKDVTGGGWTRGDVTVQTAAGSDAGASCAGNGLCAVTSGDGKIAVTSSPGHAHWHLDKVKGGRWQAVSCPTTKRCVAAGSLTSGAGTVAISHGAGSWKHTKIGPNFTPKISCASASSCFVTSNYYASKPAPKKPAWKKVKVPTSGSETTVSCPTPARCFIGTSTNEFLAGKR